MTVRSYKRGRLGTSYEVDVEGGYVFAYYGKRLVGEMAVGEAPIEEALNLDEDGSLTHAYFGGHLKDYVTFVRYVSVAEPYWGRGFGAGMYRAWVMRGLPEGVAFVAGYRVGADTTESALRVWSSLRQHFLGGPGWVLPRTRP